MNIKVYGLITFILSVVISPVYNTLSAKEKDGKIIQLSAANYQKEVSEGVILVDFWAPWCGPCRTMNPIIEDLAKEYKNVIKVGKLNTDRNQQFSKNMKIQTIPLIIVYKDGEEKMRLTGVTSKEKLEKIIKEYTSSEESNRNAEKE